MVPVCTRQCIAIKLIGGMGEREIVEFIPTWFGTTRAFTVYFLRNNKNRNNESRWRGGHVRKTAHRKTVVKTDSAAEIISYFWTGREAIATTCAEGRNAC